jgi:hypothetical protein
VSSENPNRQARYTVVVQIVTQLAYNVWKWPMLVHRELELRWTEMWRMGLSEIKLLILNRAGKKEGSA